MRDYVPGSASASFVNAHSAIHLQRSPSQARRCNRWVLPERARDAKDCALSSTRHPVLVLCSQNTPQDQPHNDLKTFIHGVNQGCPPLCKLQKQVLLRDATKTDSIDKGHGRNHTAKGLRCFKLLPFCRPALSTHHARGSHSTCYTTLSRTHTHTCKTSARIDIAKGSTRTWHLHAVLSGNKLL